MVSFDSDWPTIRLYTYSASVGISSKKQIGAATLSNDNSIGFIYSNKNPKIKICLIKYQIKKLQLKKNNHFLYQQNIFQDPQFEEPLKKNNNQETQIENDLYQKIQELPEQRSVQIIELQSNEKTLQQKMMQASKIVDQSMKEAEQDRKLFSKYLDNSNSFIKTLMESYEKKQEPQTKTQNISAIKQQQENQEGLSTQQKWYINNFHKENYGSKSKKKINRDHFIKNTKKELNQKINIIYLQNEEQNKVDKMYRQISDILIDCEHKVKEIIIMIEKQTETKDIIKIATLTKVDEEIYSNIWPVHILVKETNPIHISCKTQKEQLVGCIGKFQEKRGQCQLFNIEGKKQGIFSFKIKMMGSSFVQTSNVITQKNQQKYKQLRRNQIIDNGTFENQIHLISILPQKQMKSTEQLKYGTERDGNYQVNQVKQEKREVKKEPGKIYLNIPKLHHTNLQSSNQNTIPLTLVSMSKTPQYLKKLQSKQYKFHDSSGTQNIYQMNSPQINSSQVDSQIDKIYADNLQQPNKKDEIIYSISPQFCQQPDGSQVKKIEATYFILQKQAIKMAEPQKLINSIVHVKTEKKAFQSLNNNKQLNSFHKERPSTERDSKITEKQLKRGNDLVNLKISRIQLKLEKPNFKQIFMKLVIDNDSTPYFTQTSNQLYHLMWMGKGYFFLNLTDSSKLSISMFENDRNLSAIKGICQININQLDTKQKGMLEYEDVLYDQNQKPIGKLFLEYQFFQRKNSELKSLSLAPVVQKLQSYQTANRNLSKPFETNRQFKYRLKQLYKIKDVNSLSKRKYNFIDNKMRSAVTEGNERTQKRIYLHDKVFNLLSGKNEGSLKVRKYTGGNIIIPRAPRFKTTGNQLFGESPRRLYECQYQFEKYYSKRNKY